MRALLLPEVLDDALFFDDALFDDAVFDEALLDEALLDEALLVVVLPLPDALPFAEALFEGLCAISAQGSAHKMKAVSDIFVLMIHSLFRFVCNLCVVLAFAD
jgi:hypothetical protein